MTLPRVAVSLGDPGGIGPEVVLKALANPAGLPEARYLIFGAADFLASEARALGLHAAGGPDDGGAGRPGIFWREAGPAPRAVVRGPTAENGAASFRWFEAAANAARAGEADAVVTAPVSKAAWRMAGVPFRGHTEYLDSRHPGAIMTFWSPRLKVALLSHHLPLREALDRVRKDRLLDFLKRLGAGVARLAPAGLEFLVAGLNPHAGEAGLLGTEEESDIAPAVREARAAGLRVEGPFPPDVVFRRAMARPGTMAVALYHDQGLIPFKLEAFSDGVNATLGLPFLRTSPDHGTAYDIAGRGDADPGSMLEALKLAASVRPGPRRPSS